MEKFELFVDKHIDNHVKGGSIHQDDLRNELLILGINKDRLDDCLNFLDDEITQLRMQSHAEKQGKTFRLIGIVGLIVFPMIMLASYFGHFLSGHVRFYPFGILIVSMALFLIANEKQKTVLEMKRRRTIRVQQFYSSL